MDKKTEQANSIKFVLKKSAQNKKKQFTMISNDKIFNQKIDSKFIN